MADLRRPCVHAAVIELQNTVAQLEAALERSSASVDKAEVTLASAAAMAIIEVPGRFEELKAGKTLTCFCGYRVTRFQCEEELELAQRTHAALQRELEIAKIKLTRGCRRSVLGSILRDIRVRQIHHLSAADLKPAQTPAPVDPEWGGESQGCENQPSDSASRRDFAYAVTDIAPSSPFPSRRCLIAGAGGQRRLPRIPPLSSKCRLRSQLRMPGSIRSTGGSSAIPFSRLRHADASRSPTPAIRRALALPSEGVPLSWTRRAPSVLSRH